MLERDVASLGAACAPGLAAPLLGGAVGFLTYEAAGRYERLPLARSRPTRTAAPVVRHLRHRRRVRPCAAPPAALQLRAPRRPGRDWTRPMPGRCARIDDAARRHLRGGAGAGGRAVAGLPSTSRAHDHEANLSRDEFQERVRRALDYIVAGDIFQVQVSRRFAVAAAGGSVRRLHRAPGHQPQPVHDLHRHPGVHPGRCLAGDAGPGHRARASATTPSPGPGGAGGPPRTTSAWSASFAPATRRRPSTSCSSTSAATTSDASAPPAACASRSTWRSSATRT